MPQIDLPVALWEGSSCIYRKLHFSNIGWFTKKLLTNSFNYLLSCYFLLSRFWPCKSCFARFKQLLRWDPHSSDQSLINLNILVKTSSGMSRQAQTCSDMLRSSQINSNRLRSTQINSNRIESVWIDSERLRLTQIDSNQLK